MHPGPGGSPTRRGHPAVQYKLHIGHKPKAPMEMCRVQVNLWGHKGLRPICNLYYSVGIETPRFWATSRGDIPPFKSLRADSTFPGVIRRLRPLYGRAAAPRPGRHGSARPAVPAPSAPATP